jgi:hypothetical protein
MGRHHAGGLEGSGMKVSSTLFAALGASFALLSAGCSVSSQVSAVSVQAENGQVVTDEWHSSSRCGLAVPGSPPCSAASVRRQQRLVVEP